MKYRTIKKFLRKNRTLAMIYRKVMDYKDDLNRVHMKDVPIGDKPIKIVGFVICYNEAKNGRLEECLTHLKTFCDDIVFCDNSSTDNSLEIAKRFTSQIIQLPNEFTKEIEHKQKMLDKALELDPDWIMSLDCDEVLGIDETKDTMQRLCQYGDKIGVDVWMFQIFQMWKRYDKYRIDGMWNRGWTARLWKNTGRLRFEVKEGLHGRLYPLGVDKMKQVDVKMIHFGYSTEKYVNDKYEWYKKWGQPDWALFNLKDESTLELGDFPVKWYPQTIQKKFT